VIYHTVPGSFTDEHRRVLGRVSEQAAAVIFNSTRFEQTEHESQTDPLTGMANRRSLDRQFEAGVARVSMTGGTGSLVVLDLDRLKEINDTYGHDAGIGRCARSATCCADGAPGRSVRPLRGRRVHRRAVGVRRRGQAHRMKELQQAVAAHPFEPRPGVRVSLSISAGAARFPQDSVNFEELLAVADERMPRQGRPSVEKFCRAARTGHVRARLAILAQEDESQSSSALVASSRGRSHQAARRVDHPTDRATQRVGDPVPDIGAPLRGEHLVPFVAGAVDARQREQASTAVSHPSPSPTSARQNAPRPLYRRQVKQLVPDPGRDGRGGFDSEDNRKITIVDDRRCPQAETPDERRPGIATIATIRRFRGRCENEDRFRQSPVASRLRRWPA
jgi:GGDEF domain-containing protein